MLAFRLGDVMVEDESELVDGGDGGDVVFNLKMIPHTLCPCSY
jgi:hypothetical protein